MKFKLRTGSVFAIAGTLFLVFASTTVIAQTASRQVAEIGKLAAEADRMAVTAERDEYSSVFIVELNVNQKENPYPAVGTYTSTAKFYYTYGDREKNPYPDKLVKIAVTTRRSSATELTEIYFRGRREMILYTKKVEGAEASDRRIFLSAGRPVQFERQGKVMSIMGADAIAFVTEAIADKTRFEGIFRAATK